MTNRGPLRNHLLRLAVVLAAISACAQSPPNYDAATETKVKGMVQELKFVPPSGAKQIGYLVLKNGEATIQVFLGPKSFLDEMGIAFKPGDDVQVTGSKIKQDNADVILAREVTKSGDILTLRFADGKPAW